MNSTYRTTGGYPYPYGSSLRKDGVNFALYSKNATEAILCLWLDELVEIPLDPLVNKTGDVWHVYVHGIREDVRYAYRVDGTSDNILDPYAKEFSSERTWDGQWDPLSLAIGKQDFDWEGDHQLRIPLNALIIYEMHVRGFTRDDSSAVHDKGTFLGVVEKIPYLVDLGINAVELMPVFAFNQLENTRVNPLTNEKLYNYWGYSPISFFSPMNRYVVGTNPGDAIREFKTMVKALHRNGIEVILDVVYNHTVEGGEGGPALSWKAIDRSTYYLLDEKGGFLDFTGCGNTFNCNHPVTAEMIRDSLRYWVTEMHVDGFRFDLASVLTRGIDGRPLPSAPLIQSLSQDPILANTKLIAEPWDLGGLYQVGHFHADSNRWCEWNDKYRNTVRCFIKGSPGEKRTFATRICGSQDLYGNKGSPLCSINFYTSHDGFTLADLVSYNRKHNLSNGEENRDGNDNTNSWNCGVEGDTDDPHIHLLRERQMRNYHLALMLSQGVPMVLMGDEYGHSKSGNNNAWCHDNALNWFLWEQLKERSAWHRFFRGLIHFRRNHPFFKLTAFLSESDVQWHGVKPLKPEWDEDDQFLAFTLVDHHEEKHLYAAFNVHTKSIAVEFPNPPEGKQWHWVVNTGLPSPADYNERPDRFPVGYNAFEMLGHASILLEAL